MFDLTSQSIAFLSYCKNRKALNSKTLKAYYIDLKQFIAYSHDSFNRESICSYISLLHNTFKPKTARRKIATLKAFTHFIMIEDIIKTNPFDKIETSFREPIILPKTIPLETIESILSTAYTQLNAAHITEYSKKCITRDIAVLELLFTTGARVSQSIRDMYVNSRRSKLNQ